MPSSPPASRAVESLHQDNQWPQTWGKLEKRKTNWTTWETLQRTGQKRFENFQKRACNVQTRKPWTFDMPQCLMTPRHVRKFHLAIFLRPWPSFAFLPHLPSTAPTAPTAPIASAPSSNLWRKFSRDVQMVVDAVDPHRRPQRYWLELGGTRMQIWLFREAKRCSVDFCCFVS